MNGMIEAVNTINPGRIGFILLIFSAIALIIKLCICAKTRKTTNLSYYFAMVGLSIVLCLYSVKI